MADPKPANPEWAAQRRLEDLFAKIAEKYGDLTGRFEVKYRPDTTFDQIGGLKAAKATLRGFATALTAPEVYRQWGITPPKGVLLYGPPGTGKSLLARALASVSEATFYHLKLLNLTSKFGPTAGDLLQEILAIAVQEPRTLIFLDEADALSLEHLLPPPQAREASARLIAVLAEKLDGIEDFSRVFVVAATSRTDAIDPSLVAPGRLDRLIEVPLPDPQGQQEIFLLNKAQAEKAAARRLFAELDFRSLLPPMGGMSGAEIQEVIRRALETKAHRAGAGEQAGLVSTQDLLQEIDGYRRIKEVVEKIRYGQYL
ncbi:MAG: AAA family ATPase [Candidatus Rokubacteria bacterium]|nr:AAA family ATPase [Candidatus Rokubacteria bacterium]MBI2555079.1 AAA family ATPase [Candidatus Rokubacteria bacterium]